MALNAIYYSSSPASAGENTMSVSTDTFNGGSTTATATALIYADFYAWDSWRIQVSTEAEYTEIANQLAYTDAYAIKSTLTFEVAQLASG